MAVFAAGHAVLIGVGDYRDAAWRAPVTANDARGVAAALTDPAVAAYPPGQVKLLCDGDATRRAVVAALEALAAVVTPDDTAVVFFSGHGLEDADGEYVFTTHDTEFYSENGRELARKGTGLSRPEILESLREVRAGKLLFIINTCFSGSVGPAFDPVGGASGAPLPEEVKRDVLSTGEGRAVMTAGGELQYSYYRKTDPYSRFGQALIDGLRGHGVPNRGGCIGLFDLYDYVYTTVKAGAGGPQEPTLSLIRGVGRFPVALHPGGSGGLPFRDEPGPASAATVVARELAERPFVVPFLPRREGEFVGRDDDLRNLHARLKASRTIGLVGMGGVGKTRLAVEYVIRHRDDYRDGVFWIDISGPLTERFAALALDHRLNWARIDDPRDEQIRTAFAALGLRPGALLVVDNLTDPRDLFEELAPGCTAKDLACSLLFTTRPRDLGKIEAVEVLSLAPEPALRMLLRHPRREAARGAEHPDHDAAVNVCRRVGWLPLALELAGAYLGKRPERPVADYDKALEQRGLLRVLDGDETPEAAVLERIHQAAAEATVASQWDDLGQDDDRLILRVAGELPEAAALPTQRLGLLAGVDTRPRDELFDSPLDSAVRRLLSASLLNPLQGGRVSLHPIVRAFAAGQTDAAQADAFRVACANRLAATLSDYDRLEAEARRTIVELEEDLLAALRLADPPGRAATLARGLDPRLRATLRVLQLESHLLRDWDPAKEPTTFAQRVQIRATATGHDGLKAGAERRFATTLRRPHVRLLWQRARVSPAMVRTIQAPPDGGPEKSRACFEAVGVTPDGRRAVAGTKHGALGVWDLDSGRELLRVPTGDYLFRLVVTADGRRVVTAGGALRVHDLGSGHEILILKGHTGGVSALALTPDGRCAVSGGADHTVRLWDLADGRELACWSGHTGKVLALTVSPDGRYAASSSDDDTVRVWDVTTGDTLRVVDGRHCRSALGIAFLPDGRRVVNATALGIAFVWDVDTGRALYETVELEGAIRSVAAMACGRGFVTVCDDRTFRVWDADTGLQLQALMGHEGLVDNLALAPDDRLAVTTSLDGTARVWRLDPAALFAPGVAPAAVLPENPMSFPGRWDGRLFRPDPRVSLTAVGHFKEVNSVSAAAGGTRVASAADDGSIRIWDRRDGRLLGVLNHHEELYTVGVAADGRYAYVDLGYRKHGFLDLDSGDLVERSVENMRHLGVGVVGSQPVAVAQYPGKLRFWSLKDGRVVRYVVFPHEPVKAVAQTRAGRWVAVTTAEASGGTTTLTAWDPESGQAIGRLDASDARVHIAAVSRDGRRVVAILRDNSVLVWDVASGGERHRMTGHEKLVCAVELTTDGRRAVTASTDTTLRLWDLDAGLCLATVRLDSVPVCLSLIPADGVLVVGESSGCVAAYRLDFGDPPPPPEEAQGPPRSRAARSLVAWLTAALRPVAWVFPWVRAR